jgi:hypothetical protein
MTEVNHSKRDMMSTQQVSIFTVKPDKQGTELIDPSKTALAGEALFVNLGVEQAFAPCAGSGTRSALLPSSPLRTAREPFDSSCNIFGLDNSM